MSKRRRGQLNPHLRNIRRQRTPENKACLPAGSTSSLTSSTCKACWRQIYKTCEENQKKSYCCIHYLHLATTTLRGTYLELLTNKIIHTRSFPATNTSSSSGLLAVLLAVWMYLFFFPPSSLYTDKQF